MKERDNVHDSLLTAARIHRALPTAIIILFAMSLFESAVLEVLLLIALAFLTYAPIGIHNAMKDKDYTLPSYSPIATLTLSLAAIIISLFDMVLLATVILWLVLGYTYNTTSRKIVLLDTTIISVTHYALPFFSAAILLGADTFYAFKLSLFIFTLFWFLTPIKNLKGVEEDKKRNYKTLPTTLKKGKEITFLFFQIAFLLMIYAYFFFDLHKTYFLFLVSFFVLDCTSIRCFIQGKDKKALSMVRLMIILFLVGLITGGFSYYG